MTKDDLKVIIAALEHSKPNAANYEEPVARHRDALRIAKQELALLEPFRTVVEGEHITVIRNADGASIAYPVSDFWSRSPEQLSVEAIELARHAAAYIWG